MIKLGEIYTDQAGYKLIVVSLENDDVTYYSELSAAVEQCSVDEFIHGVAMAIYKEELL